MNPAFARVLSNIHLYGNTFLTWFDAPDVARTAKPGQFVMFRCVEADAAGGLASLADDPLLPRAMSIHRVRESKTGREWAILYDVVGRGTTWLSVRQPGDVIACWGPLGQGFEVPGTSENLLLVAGGIGIAPLIWLAEDAISQRRNVTMIAGARTATQVFPRSQLPREVELVVYTEDGSLGRTGRATDGLDEYATWADQTFACGPNAMFGTMAQIIPRDRLNRVQVLLEERMGCGTGICYGCAIRTRRRMQLVCKDGPKFSLADLEW